MIPVCRDLDHLFPPFREKVERVRVEVLPYNFDIFETFRFEGRQQEIWEKGRALQNGVWVVVNPKEVATKSPPGSSYHEYGLATDVVTRIIGLNPKLGTQWSWDDYDLTAPGKQPIPWKILINSYVKNGITAGANFKNFPDLPHGQCEYGFKVSELYPILTKEGIEAVWKLVMTNVPASPSTVVVPIQVPAAIAAPQISRDPIPMVTLDAPHDNDAQLGFFGQLLRSLARLFSRKAA